MPNREFEEKLTERGVCFCGDKRLSSYTSFKIGGEADFVIKPKTADELSLIVKTALSCGVDYYFLGNGTNILASDDGYRGAVILSESFDKITLRNDAEIVCESGVTMARLCAFAQEHSLSGLEFAFGIPGSVGGGIYMNAGAYGGEIKDVAVACEYMSKDGEIGIYRGGALDFSYRRSAFSGNDLFILNAVFSLKRDDKAEIRARMDDYLSRRKLKQPLEYPSAGSTFKRPANGYASAIIDECGLKGMTVGGAQVSEKHAGFVINTGNATAGDVIELVDKIKRIVLKEKGTELECEICTLGI